jgi:hypothetical protein
MAHSRWRTSSYSGGGEYTDCVEISLTTDHAGIRDSKNTTGPALTVTPENWAAFVTYTTHE